MWLAVVDESKDPVSQVPAWSHRSLFFETHLEICSKKEFNQDVNIIFIGILKTGFKPVISFNGLHKNNIIIKRMRRKLLYIQCSSLRIVMQVHITQYQHNILLLNKIDYRLPNTRTGYRFKN